MGLEWGKDYYDLGLFGMISILSETILDRGLPLNKRTTACAKNVETAENPVTTRVYFLHWKNK